MKTFFLTLSLLLFAILTFAQVPSLAIKSKSTAASGMYVHDATIYPNPVTESFFKVKSDDVVLSIEVMNVVGQQVYAFSNESQTKEDITVVLEHCDKGMYLVKITFNDNRSIIKKILLK